jgi:uroporphyrinogen decarboxylase
MTSRERLLTSLDHREPDRVPMFHPNMIRTYDEYDETLLEYLEEFPFDEYAHVGGTENHPAGQHELPDGTLEDGYGCRFEYKGVGMPYCTHSPLAEAESVEDVEAFPWPDPDECRVIEDAAEKARETREKGDRLVVTGMPPTFHRYHYLRGFEQWMLDVRLNPEIHRAIAGRIAEINLSILMRVLEEVGEYVDMVNTGDDFGMSSGPYMSRPDFQELIKPVYAEFVGTVKERCPGVKFYLHSHGQIMDIVPDLIECGVDVLNPILPLDNMDPVALKRDHGDELCFHGGIDIERIVPLGSEQQVQEHVREVIDIMAPGGGYWLKLQAISPVCPPENVMAAYEEAREYGGYR